ncbi:MAG: hypothetical protein KIT25_15990 [Enhydrobacter sp.]|nr:MAG: hypothetical protein KIT25_15990 [Enhydrobacter sp.]
MEGWDNFFLGQVGASAALAGLLFVAVSLNASRILALPMLPDRALAALSLLLAILVVSSLMLIPGQPWNIVGAGMLAVGVGLSALGIALALRSRGDIGSAGRAKTTTNFVLFAAAVLPYAAGGLAMLAGAEGAGVYFVATAIVLSFIKAVLDAWVLLIEINR